MPDFYSIAPYSDGDEQLGCRPRVQLRDWKVVRRDGARVLKGVRLTFIQATELVEDFNAARAAQPD